jgi:hypothetical protein
MRGKFPVYIRRAGFRLALAKEKATSCLTRARARDIERTREKESEKEMPRLEEKSAAKLLVHRALGGPRK